MTNTGTQLAEILATVILNLSREEQSLIESAGAIGTVHSGRPGVSMRALTSLVEAGLLMATGGTRYELTIGGAMIQAGLHHGR